MESKPEEVPDTFIDDPLLIEPVWNRNAVWKHRDLAVSVNLLIEPVWNRNRFLVFQ